MLWHGTLNEFMLRPNEKKRIESWPGSAGPAPTEPFALAGPPVMRHGRMHRFDHADDVAGSGQLIRAVLMHNYRCS